MNRPFPSYPLDSEEMLQEERDEFSCLVHTTTVTIAASILQSQLIEGLHSVHTACFGTKQFPKIRLARYREVSLHFIWLGDQQSIAELDMWAYDRWPCNPSAETAYHLKISENLRDNYWQTNIYKCENSLVFTGATPVDEFVSKFKINPMLAKFPKLIRSILDSNYRSYQAYLQKVNKLNDFKGAKISVQAPGIDW